MRILHFCKYHGAGNDFVLIDNRSGNNALSNEEVALLCHRQLGIGGDGLMMLGKSDNADFEMIYYNSDGHQASMCGNGGRCIVAFAKHLNIIDKRTTFEAYDGLHSAEIIEWNNNCGVVKLGMEISTDIEECLKGWKIDTGSPHYIKFINSDIIKYDVVTNGRRLRYDKAFQPQGTNVDFISKINDNEIFVATYERGVENETLSCGTGVTASALIHNHTQNTTDGNYEVKVHTKGGLFNVFFKKDNGLYKHIQLQGPVTLVFEGDVILPYL